MKLYVVKATYSYPIDKNDNSYLDEGGRYIIGIFDSLEKARLAIEEEKKNIKDDGICTIIEETDQYMVCKNDLGARFRTDYTVHERELNKVQYI